MIKKPSFKLLLKLVVVLVLPIMLFQYVGNQTAIETKDKPEEAIRTIAIVNEDIGQDNKTEENILGKNVPEMLSQQTDYAWSLVSRSVAEDGLSNQNYDAVLYIPSNFTKNVLNFKVDNPSKAAITYMIQPNLEAKEHQRIHRQLANAKNMINKEMSSIYWSYVSQEVDNLKEQFDKILEKEVAFQNAMYAFYQPSSKSLAEEIERYENELVGILNQTNFTHDALSNSLTNEASAKENITQFVKALDMYTESQVKQSTLLEEYQKNNQENLQSSLVLFQEKTAVDRVKSNDYYKEKESALLEQQNNLDNQYTTIYDSLNQSQKTLESWQKNLVDQTREQKTSFENLTLDIINTYTDQLSAQFNDEVHRHFNEAFQALDDLDDTDSSTDSTQPEIDTENDVDEKLEFDQLRVTYLNLAQEIDVLKEALLSHTSLSEVELEKKWAKVDENMEELNEKIIAFENKVEAEETSGDIAKEWEAIEKDHRVLNKEIELTNQIMIEEIKTAEKQLLKNTTLKPQQKEDLATKFESLGDLKTQSPTFLATYLGTLTSYQHMLNFNLKNEEALAKKLLAEKDVQERINKTFELDQRYFEALQSDLGQTNNPTENNLTALIYQTEDLVMRLAQETEEMIQSNEQLISDLETHVDALTTQVSEINAEVFEWEESPTGDLLEGELLFQIQDNTLEELEVLSDFISDIEDNQSDVIAETTDLQSLVQNVQEESKDLNERWASNIENTELVRDDANEILGNTIIDGQLNPFVYDYLSNPVTLEEQSVGEPLTVAENRLPPVILFLVILLSGLLIGFLTQYYTHLSYIAQSSMFVLLTITVGLIISLYGLNIYTLSDSQMVLWSAVTILLLMTLSNIVRAGLIIGPFIGWLTSLIMTVFFITPMLNIIVADFHFNHPIANIYMDLLYESSSTTYAPTIGVLGVITIVVSILIYVLQTNRNPEKIKNEETV